MKPGRIAKLIIVICSILLLTHIRLMSEISAEWQEILTKIETLQANPLAPDAKEQGAAIVTWLINSHQVAFRICSTLTVPLAEKGDPVGAKLTVHSLLGAAKYAMTVPSAQQTRFDMYVAGMNGALDAYGKMVAADPKNRRKRVEKALEARDSGKLEDYVRQHSKECVE